MVPATPTPSPLTDKLAGIDATRGWAILLVIAVHSVGAVPELPFPITRVVSFGWYGVQLFFIASAFTLLASWHRSRAPVGPRTRDFFIRRFYRIAPMYYLAACAYLVLRPPGDHFSAMNMLRALLFIDGWSPQWMGTVPGSWQVVPGGWSISVEFSFYFLFPLLALMVTTLKRSLGFLLLALVLMIVADLLGRAWLMPRYDAVGVGNFLFFWFPNQLIVFAIGFTLLHAMCSPARWLVATRAWAGNHDRLVLAGVALGIAVLTQLGVSKSLSGQFPWLPTHVLVSLLFAAMVGAILCAAKPTLAYVHPFMRRLGEVSFSAYLVHWAVIPLVKGWAVALFGPAIFQTGGYTAIAVFAVVLPTIVLVTFGISWITYSTIEQPFIRTSKRLTRTRQPPPLSNRPDQPSGTTVA